MTTTSIDSIIEVFKKKHNIHLSKIPRKRIIYNGETKQGKSIIVIMPSSKIYPRGRHGWVDFTKIQVELLKQYQFAVAVFRLSDGNNYYINMRDLFPLLSENNMMTNNKEGDHWKLDIWPNKIIVRNGGEELKVNPNESQFINQFF